jgi:hypothetical protein
LLARHEEHSLTAFPRVVGCRKASSTDNFGDLNPLYAAVTHQRTADGPKKRNSRMGKTAKCSVTKRQNGRKSRTVNKRIGRGAGQGAQKTKKIPQETKNIKSPSIKPEIQQTELMVERESSNSKKPELYMLNEAEFIRTFGWWGLH